ncbi:4Fe-4S binding protein [Sabulilitoribacter arenilitoris]|uniref:4Fe-4S binding protein n=1 Tax=Wocania arenilitoris TaxID=2044858 RepID=A0AAE3EQ51_9FLAO|nr:4Fe-4S binding protein [Wocania arenilitoris]MCF7568144.1 4Fe-4S binding protein [Wocania arenilitoris]
MKTQKHIITNANEAVAKIAYKTNEVFPIYPITPASEMSELVEQWSSEKKENIFESAPSVFQMQSEAGVAGAMHGALQTGSLSTTFTASQGLLLMLPNMFKIAGELTPNVIHVATRSVATHALSIFGDHSDIMAVRQSGYAMLGSSSVQEAQDFALIAQAASLESKIPFVHFFDGFRTSHETSKIEAISDGTIQYILNQKEISTHQERALNPNNPVIRGTAQGADVFFQSREAINPFYEACPNTVQHIMDTFRLVTGRSYKLFDYIGHAKAEHIIVSMASSTETIEQTVNLLNKKGERFGLIKVRLFRPFSTKHLIASLPKSVKSIAVLDRTKEPGSTGEPLYLDILQSISEAYQNNKITSYPKIVGGRYGLSSKEFTPSMVNAIFKNLKQDQPKNNFTIGIKDDVKYLSLDYSENINIENNAFQAIFNQEKNDIHNKSFINTLNHIGNNKNVFVQGYTQINYKKSNTYNRAHLRINNTKIKSPYLIENADFIGCQNAHFAFNDDTLNNIKPEGTLLVNTSLTSKAFWQSVSANNQYQIIEKNINLLIVNIEELKEINILNDKPITELHACFLALRQDDFCTNMLEYIYKVDTKVGYNKEALEITEDPTFSKTLLGRLLNNKGNSIPVSLLPVDGTYQTDNSKFNTVHLGNKLPEWDLESCTQCGACSMVCPQAALRIKAFDDAYLENAPTTFKSTKSLETDWEIDLLSYTIQVNPEQCNGCNNCVDACPAKALTLTNKDAIVTTEKENWNHFKSIPELNRSKIDVTKVSQQQLQEPLFKYPSGVEGCGEAAYLKLMSQLFGDRLLVANATGASSIFGGALPTTPWSKNKNGQGPAWSNSLFEDNAEFGLGYRLSIDNKEQQAKALIEKLIPQLDFDLAIDILKSNQNSEIEIFKQRQRVEKLKLILKKINTPEAHRLLNICDNLVKKSVWIVGGDGWAYDIGFGGLDHVLASGKNVNILVLDNEVYDNTGGQASKATPFGGEAKFAFNGKQKQKKDLGFLAMNYDNVYVASVAIGANKEQTLQAFNKAESFDGPSIIIAYCHSDSHGIDIKKPSQYHKAAVNSGQWLLYRNDPRKTENNQNTLQLDSDLPSIKIEDYLKKENRFSKLFKRNKGEFNSLMFQIQKQIDRRFDKYVNMASYAFINRSKLIRSKKIKKQLNYKSENKLI